jgi:hypothetical protein
MKKMKLFVAAIALTACTFLALGSMNSSETEALFIGSDNIALAQDGGCSVKVHWYCNYLNQGIDGYWEGCNVVV